MSTPTVAVIVTCYNLGQYLNEALDSVFAQTFQDFEVIVVDDGSDDPGTLAVLTSIQRPHTRVIHTPNRGLPAARNEGIRRSSGRLLCALDADDRLEPTWLEKAVAFLETNPHITFVSHWLRTFGEESSDWTPDRCDLETLLTVNTVNGAALVRREVVIEVGGYDETMVHGCEDWDLWLTMVERGFTGAIIPEVLFFYRRRPNSMSREMSEGDRPQRLLETLVRKHEGSYRQHIGRLVAARERELVNTRRAVNACRLEHVAVLLPQVARSRRQLHRLRDQAERVRHRLAHQAELETLRETLELTREHLEASEADRRRLSAVEAEAGRLHRDLAELHASLTWRLSSPVRKIVGWLRRPGGD